MSLDRQVIDAAGRFLFTAYRPGTPRPEGSGQAEIDAPVPPAALAVPLWNPALGAWIEGESSAERAAREAATLAQRAAAARVWRDRALSACDWTQVSDAPLSAEQRATWATYRTALRDWPEAGTGFPDIATMPKAPGA